MLTEDQIKKLSDRELQEEEHDTQVDFFDDLTGSSYLRDKMRWIDEEMKLRKLEPLPRLNGCW